MNLNSKTAEVIEREKFCGRILQFIIDRNVKLLFCDIFIFPNGKNVLPINFCNSNYRNIVVKTNTKRWITGNVTNNIQLSRIDLICQTKRLNEVLSTFYYRIWYIAGVRIKRLINTTNLINLCQRSIHML